LVKVTSAALLGSVAVMGTVGFGVSSGLPVEVCTGDFIIFCRPVEYPALGIFLLAAGAIAALSVAVTNYMFGSLRERKGKS